MSLGDFETFLRVAELGSLTAAARHLGVPTSTVSRRVARLEAELGETLVVRTPRALRLTEAGAAVFERCAVPLREIDEVARAVRDRDAEPQGELRVTAPPDVGSTEVFVRMIQGYREAWPRVSVRVELTERVVDLVAERVDVALRAHVGPLPDRASLIARPVARMAGGVYASEAFVARHGRPEHPGELRGLPVVAHTRVGTRSWRLVRGEEEVEVPVHPVVVANDMAFVRQALLLDGGVGILPTLSPGPGLVRLVPEWATQAGTLSLVWAGGRALAPRVRRFVEHVTRVVGETACAGHGRAG